MTIRFVPHTPASALLSEGDYIAHILKNAGKLLVMVDEVLLNRPEDTERLKNLSTALIYKMEAKSLLNTSQHVSGKKKSEIALDPCGYFSCRQALHSYRKITHFP